MTLDGRGEHATTTYGRHRDSLVGMTGAFTTGSALITMGPTPAQPGDAASTQTIPRLR